MLRCAAFAAVLAIALPSLAGPLNPPKGPITSTSKPLAEIEPRTPISATTTPGDEDSLFRITAPGSYYLTGNIDGVAGKHGIKIATSGVAIDLCGFTMTGPEASLRAITNDDLRQEIVVRNGTIRGWPGGGVILNFGRNCTITDIVVNGAGGVGIEASAFSTIRNCAVDGTIGSGFTVACIQGDTNVIIESCRVSFSSADGISINHDCTVRQCDVSSIVGVGIRSATGSNLIEGCTVSLAQPGIVTGAWSIVRDCSIQQCAGDAIFVNNQSNRIEGNHIVACSRGLHVTSAGNIVVRNTAKGNGTNFDVVAGNFGQYLVAAPGGAFAGNAGGVALGSPDSNANYSY